MRLAHFPLDGKGILFAPNTLIIRITRQNFFPPPSVPPLPKITAFHATKGLSQAQRKVLSKGLASNGATVLSSPTGESAAPSPDDLLVKNASQLLMNAAGRTSTKRKHEGGGDTSTSKKSGKSQTKVRVKICTSRVLTQKGNKLSICLLWKCTQVNEARRKFTHCFPV